TVITITARSSSAPAEKCLAVIAAYFSLCPVCSNSAYRSCRAVHALPACVERRHETVSIRLSRSGIPRLGTPGRDGTVKLGRSQPGFPAPVNQGAIIRVPHSRLQL